MQKSLESKTCEMIESQNAIIRIQSGVIDELFRLLMQHVTVDELDNMRIIDRINLAADLRKAL